MPRRESRRRCLANGPKTVLPSHRLSPGDAVVIEAMTLRRDLQIPADQRVLADGSVDLGPCGRLIVAGRTLEACEALVEAQVRSYLESQSNACNEPPPVAGVDLDDTPNCDSIVINVRLLDPIHRYYVLGAVNAPGGYPLIGHETVPRRDRRRWRADRRGGRLRHTVGPADRSARLPRDAAGLLSSNHPAGQHGDQLPAPPRRPNLRRHAVVHGRTVLLERRRRVRQVLWVSLPVPRSGSRDRRRGRAPSNRQHRPRQPRNAAAGWRRSRRGDRDGGNGC